MPAVLHVLPHRGGGAETYLELLGGIPGYSQQVFAIAAASSTLAAAPSIARRWPALARRVVGADLVHVHGDAAALLSLPLLARAPSVWTTHGLHLLRRRPAARRGVRAAIRRTRVTICTSQAEADELSALAGAELEERLTVVRNGVTVPTADESLRERARTELGIAEGEVAALFLGELSERKRPLDAVAAARDARAAGAPLVLLVAGEGPLTGAVAAQASDAVRPLGFRSDRQRLLAACDVFVLPSSREGLSFALLEAMAHGLASVVADGPGNPEAVGAAGIVVPSGNRAALADALIELAGDPMRRASLGAAARERVEREFPLGGLLDGVRRSYERALRAPGRDGAGEPA